MIRTIAKSLPVISNSLDMNNISMSEGWYWCKYYSWDLEKKDFIEFADIFFFDGKEFHTEHLCDYDGADWIFSLIDIVGGNKFKEYE